MTIEATAQQAEAQLMQLPNVIGVGTGMKNGKTVIKVLVTRKVKEADLQTQEIIPKQIGPYETDVEEIGNITAQ